MSTLTVYDNAPVPLTKCYKANGYYHFNDYKISSDHWTILAYGGDYYEICMVNFNALAAGSGYYDLKHLTFEVIWRILEPPTDFTIIQRGDKCITKCHMTKSDITISEGIDHKIIGLLRAKLHATETAFKKKLRENKSPDCKIDFF
jgi:hypothetical protein